jgi:hypothetical protein
MNMASGAGISSKSSSTLSSVLLEVEELCSMSESTGPPASGLLMS